MEKLHASRFGDSLSLRSRFSLSRRPGHSFKKSHAGCETNKLGIERLEERHLLAGVPMITEFMAKNDGVLRDGDGQRSDWIEIQNVGDMPLDLAGYRLTDNASELSRWTFPSKIVDPGEYLVVFASGQEQNNYVDAGGHLHTNFKLSSGGEYLALIAPDGTIATEYGTSSTSFPPQISNISYGVAQRETLFDEQSDATYWAPDSDAVDSIWTGLEFDALAHQFVAGKAAMGYEGDPDSRNSFSDEFITELPAEAHGVYARIDFDVDNASDVNRLNLRVKNDNGFIAYLNGTKVVEQNASAASGWFSIAETRSPTDSKALQSVDYDLTSHVSQLVEGRNVLAVHVLNHITDREDMLFVPQLIASVTSPDAQVGFMPTPTPGAENLGSTSVFVGTVGDVEIDGRPGFHDAPFTVSMTSETPDAEIRYTTNGAIPTATTGTSYTGPVTIETTTVLRAAAFKTDHLPSDAATQSYLFLEDVIRQSNDQPGLPTRWEQQPPVQRYPADYEMDQEIVNDPAYRDEIVDGLRSIPTFSIVIDPDELWAPVLDENGRPTGEIGGLYIDSDLHGRDSERPISLEIIEPDGSLGTQVNAGLRNHGNRTRDFDVTLKQSMRLVFRGEYGASKLEYPLFPEAPVDRFDNIVVHATKILDDPQLVRNSFGRDTNIAMGNPEAHSTHVHLYLNGLYWGIYNPFERPDAEFAAERFGGSEQDYSSVLTDGTEVVDGTRDAYNSLFQLMRTFETEEEYEELQRQADLDGLIDLLLVNQYMAHDEHEMQVVGRNEGDANFRFFAHDLDEKGMGCVGRCLTSAGNVNISTDITGFLPTGAVAAMRTNPELQLRFADRAQKHLFNDGALTPQVAQERWEGLYGNIFSAVIAETARWGDTHWRTIFERETAKRDDQLAREGTFLREQWFPQRTDIVLSQLRRSDLYPEIEAPTWNQFGGAVQSGFQLEMNHDNPTGNVLYTLDGSDPRKFGGDASPSALIYDGTPVAITGDTVVKSRVLSDGQWSALTESSFVIASDFPLRITEINYSPHAANLAPGVTEEAAERDQFEFIELTNIGDQPVDLAGVQFARSNVQGDTQGISFTFAQQQLAPGGHVVVVRDRESFESRYGNSIPIAVGNDGDGGDEGEYGGRLSDSGEQLTLMDATGQLIQQFAYKARADWPARANGGGSSLEIVDLEGGLTDPSNWRASIDFGGSPGTAGATSSGIAISEILANTDSSDADMVELFNSGSQEVDIQHWYVSDTARDYFKSKISTSTVISASGYQTLPSSELGIDLDGVRGGELIIVSGDADGRPSQFVDHVEFGTAGRGVSLGPWPTLADSFIPLNTTTFGSPNDGPQVSDVVISEVYFHPQDPDGDRGIQPRDLEYIEVANTSNDSVDLSGWHLGGDFAYEFPAGTTLDAGGSAVLVSFDPASRTGPQKVNVLRFLLGMPPTQEALGEISDPNDRRSRDVIKDGGALVQLVRPGLPAIDDPNTIPMIVVDQVSYLPTPPWPQGTAGEGKSLTRARRGSYGPLSSSWIAAAPSPGTFEFAGRLAGDSNEDGQFNQLDLVQVLQGGKYQTGQPATFGEGDWNEDGFFNQLDIVAALQTGAYLAPAAAVSQGVKSESAAIDASFAKADDWLSDVRRPSLHAV